MNHYHQQKDTENTNERVEMSTEGNYFSKLIKLKKEKTKLYPLLGVVFILLIAGGAYYQLYLKEEKYEPVIIGFDYQRAYQDGLYLIKNGPRLAGTEEEYRAAYYIEQEFKKAGLENVHIENYTVDLYEVNSASLGLQAFSMEKGFIDKNYRHLYDFTVLGYSGSTDGEESFDVVFVGNGTEEAYQQAGDVSGKAVLVKTDGSLTYTELYIQAMNHSAAASVIYGDRLKAIARTSTIPDKENGGVKPITSEYDQEELIPHLMLSLKIGEEIRSWVENSTDPGEYCQLNIDFDVTIEPRTTMVVVGEIVGKEKPEDFVVMGAHHDTVYTGEGGADNTAGTCAILETARQLAKYKPKKTIRIITFGAEEAGLFGSKAYVLNHSKEIEEHAIFMINFDMISLNVTEDGKNNSFPVNTNSEKRKEEIEKLGKEFFKKNPDLAEKYDFSVGIMENKPYSDYFHFGYHGTDFAACWGRNAPGYHTPGDKLKYTNPESWQIAGRIMGSYALYLANK